MTTPPHIFSIKGHILFPLNFRHNCHARPNLLTMIYLDALETAALVMPISMFEDMRFTKHKSSVLMSMPGFEHVNSKFFKGKHLRQVVKGEVDAEGTDISGFFVLCDGGVVLLYGHSSNASKWSNNIEKVNKKIAPSLTYIPNSQNSVSFMELSNFLYYYFFWY